MLIRTGVFVLAFSVAMGCSPQSETDRAPDLETAGMSQIGGAPPASGDTVTTESGLQYIVVQQGSGETAQPGQQVRVHYTGWLTDGTKFDSSVDRGQPFAFPLGQGRVIRGWDEGVAGMNVGERRRLIIPAELAYGDRGAGGVIPPGATLIFDVELLEIADMETAGMSEISGPPPVSGDTVTTESGLQYIVVQQGSGETAQPGQQVRVHYTGWLTDGTKFDSSVDRGQPFAFPLGQGRVIRGWDEGVAGMNVGERRRLIIPAELAYGDRGAGGVIPPGATLIFDVELLEIAG